MNGQAERIASAVLEWRIDDSSAGALLRLEIGEDDLIIELASQVCGNWTADSAGGMLHGDFGPLLGLSLRDGKVVYARTSVLSETLNLSGGVYDGPLA